MSLPASNGVLKLCFQHIHRLVRSLREISDRLQHANGSLVGVAARYASDLSICSRVERGTRGGDLYKV